MAITLDFRRANNMLAQQNKAAAQYKAANQAMMAMEQFVPMSNQQKQNRLRTETSLSADGQHINYAIPYARAQFYGFTSSGAKIQHYFTPGTSRRWDLRLKGNKELMKTVIDAFGKELLS